MLHYCYKWRIGEIEEKVVYMGSRISVSRRGLSPGTGYGHDKIFWLPGISYSWWTNHCRNRHLQSFCNRTLSISSLLPIQRLTGKGKAISLWQIYQNLSSREGCISDWNSWPGSILSRILLKSIGYLWKLSLKYPEKAVYFASSNFGSKRTY